MSSYQQKLMTEISTTAAPQIVAGFQALAEPIRLRTIEYLQQQELCVCELCELLAVSQSKLSFHLKVLKAAGLVQTRQEGRWIYYRLNLAQFVVLEQYLAEYRRFSPILPARSCD
jgi:ArsR family transcriptional regulator, arsenate/arsenite/antimonite-responsive transcriptional repressor